MDTQIESVVVVMVIVLLGSVISFPEGPPLSACVEMRPGTQVGTTGLEGHTSMPQNYMPGPVRLSPFYIQIHQEGLHYTPGEEIQGNTN